MIAADTANLGILKTMGCTAGMLRRIQVGQYLLPVLSGIAVGILLALTPPTSAKR